MSSAQERGDAFEKAIFDYYARQIASNSLEFRSEWCRLFHQKRYYSRDRQAEIAFDVAIEVGQPGTASFSLLVLIECKDYSGSVPVGDLEEFYGKVVQVAGLRVKAIFASTAPFQRSALRYAESKGIALLRRLPRGCLKWELRRSAAWSPRLAGDGPSLSRLMIEADPGAASFDSCFFVGGRYTPSSNQALEWLCFESKDHAASDEWLRHIVNPEPPDVPMVPFRSKEDIESLAQNELAAINYVAGSVDLEALYHKVRTTTGLLCRHEPRASPTVLGRLTAEPLEITIYVRDLQSARARFTLAHELGHLLLGHLDFMAGEQTDYHDLEAGAYLRSDDHDVRRMEWQANFAAASLLLPRDQFVHNVQLIATRLDIRDRGHGLLYLDTQPENVAAFQRVVSHLSGVFHVSRHALEIRLAGLGLLHDARAAAWSQFSPPPV